MKIRGNTVGTNMSPEKVAKRLPIDAVKCSFFFDDGVLKRYNELDYDSHDEASKLMAAYSAGKEVTIYEQVIDFATSRVYRKEYLCIGVYLTPGKTVLIFQRNEEGKTITATVDNSGTVSKTESVASVPDVYEAEYNYDSQMLIRGNFNEMRKAYNAGKVVTLKTEIEADHTKLFYCVGYTPFEFSGTEGDELIFHRTIAGGIEMAIVDSTEGRVIESFAPISGLDTTLSVAGKAADAKAVGDKIAEVSEAAVVAVNESLAKKLNKYSGTGSTMFYGVNAQGEQYMHSGAISAAAYTAALRGAGGTLNVGTPTANANAVPKSYVDSIVAGFTTQLADLVSRIEALESGSGSGETMTIYIDGIAYEVPNVDNFGDLAETWMMDSCEGDFCDGGCFNPLRLNGTFIEFASVCDDCAMVLSNLTDENGEVCVTSTEVHDGARFERVWN